MESRRSFLDALHTADLQEEKKGEGFGEVSEEVGVEVGNAEPDGL